METLRLQIHANCRLRRVYFADKLYPGEWLPCARSNIPPSHSPHGQETCPQPPPAQSRSCPPTSSSSSLSNGRRRSPREPATPWQIPRRWAVALRWTRHGTQTNHQCLKNREPALARLVTLLTDRLT